MTGKEILEKLKSSLEDVSIFAHEDYDPIELGLGEVNEVDSGGGSDRGSNWYSVQHFVDHDVYIKVTGYYQSHNGTEFYDGWDGCSIVKPEEKTITVYN